MTTQIEMNMGVLDRIIRGGLGLYLLLQGIKRLGHGGTSRMVMGGTLLAHSLSGYDPLLALFKTSTRPEDDKNLFNLKKQFRPGHGDKPRNLQQPVPQQTRMPENSEQTVAEFLAVGI